MAEITPALSPEQWAKGTIEHWHYAITLRDGELVLHGVSTSVHVPAALRPALAALALHGQPCGFTREHVELLNRLAGAFAPFDGPISIEAGETVRDTLRDLAAGIAALLPPVERDHG